MAGPIFRTLIIENFKSFRGKHKITLAQEPGLYLISGKNDLRPELGPNGVGKSSLFDALFWVLWGKTIRDNKPGAAIVPWSGEKSVKAVLFFSRDGNEYVLKRTHNPNHLLLKTNDGKQEEIEQHAVAGILGMSEEMFRRTVILGQFGTLFLDLRADAQAQMFSEALGLDIWLAAAAKASAAAKAAKAESAEHELELRGIAATIETLQSERKEAQAASDSFEETAIAEIEERTTILCKKQKKLKRLQSELPDKPTLKGAGLASAILQELDDLEENEKTAKIRARAKFKQKKCTKCGQPIDAPELTDALKEIETRYAAKITAKRAQLDEAQAKAQSREKVFFDALAIWEDRHKEVVTLEDEIARLHREIAHWDKRENEDMKRVARLAQRIMEKQKESKQATQSLDAANRQIEYASFWQKAFKEIRLNIIDDVLIELEIAAMRHAGLLGLEDWGIEFQTERETTSGKVSYAFNVLLYPPDKKEAVKWESYSGGESQRLQLAVAFGLSEVLLARAGLHPSIEILDEPTRGLSAEGISDLLTSLTERAEELGRTIYLIDHHALDRGNFSKVLQVINSKEGSSFAWQ